MESLPLAEKLIGTPFSLLGGLLCLDFCNTVDQRQKQPFHDFLDTPITVLRWGIQANIVAPQTIPSMLQQLENEANATLFYQQAIHLRETIYEIAIALLNRSSLSQEALTYLNLAYQSAITAQQLTMENDRLVWHNSIPPMLDHLFIPIVLSAVQLFTNQGYALERLQQCPGCGWLFYDHSDNKRRVWCDMKMCGNRAKAKKHYERKKQKTNEE